jgi:spermidine synthase
LGVTTITQEIEDFLKSDFGKPIITNSSMQLLLKQSPSSIEYLSKAFNLTEGERNFLLEVGVGEGLFFAGLKHVAIKVISSYTEDQIITTNPEQILAAKGL